MLNIKINDTQSFVDPEITDSLLVYSKKNFVFLESQNLNVITSVSSLLNSQVSEERDKTYDYLQVRYI